MATTEAQFLNGSLFLVGMVLPMAMMTMIKKGGVYSLPNDTTNRPIDGGGRGG